MPTSHVGMLQGHRSHVLPRWQRSPRPVARATHQLLGHLQHVRSELGDCGLQVAGQAGHPVPHRCCCRLPPAGLSDGDGLGERSHLSGAQILCLGQVVRCSAVSAHDAVCVCARCSRRWDAHHSAPA